MPSPPTWPPPPPPTGTPMVRGMDAGPHHLTRIQRKSTCTRPPMALQCCQSTTRQHHQIHRLTHNHLHPQCMETPSPRRHPNTPPDPIFTEDQLHSTLQRILRLNPARPHATRRTFGRRRLHQQPITQPLPAPDMLPPHAEPEKNQFTIFQTHDSPKASSSHYPTAYAVYATKTTKLPTAHQAGST